MYHFVSLKVEAPWVSALIKSDICLIGNCSAIYKSVGIPVGFDYPDLRIADASYNLEGVIGTVSNIDYVLIDNRKC